MIAAEAGSREHFSARRRPRPRAEAQQPFSASIARDAPSPSGTRPLRGSPSARLGLYPF